MGSVNETIMILEEVEMERLPAGDTGGSVLGENEDQEEIELLDFAVCARGGPCGGQSASCLQPPGFSAVETVTATEGGTWRGWFEPHKSKTYMALPYFCMRTQTLTFGVGAMGLPPCEEDEEEEAEMVVVEHEGEALSVFAEADETVEACEGPTVSMEPTVVCEELAEVVIMPPTAQAEVEQATVAATDRLETATKTTGKQKDRLVKRFRKLFHRRKQGAREDPGATAGVVADGKIEVALEAPTTNGEAGATAAAKKPSLRQRLKQFFRRKDKMASSKNEADGVSTETCVAESGVVAVGWDTRRETAEDGEMADPGEGPSTSMLETGSDISEAEGLDDWCSLHESSTYLLLPLRCPCARSIVLRASTLV